MLKKHTFFFPDKAFTGWGKQHAVLTFKLHIEKCALNIICYHIFYCKIQLYYLFNKFCLVCLKRKHIMG